MEMSKEVERELLAARLIALSAECHDEALALSRAWGIELSEDMHERAWEAKRATLAADAKRRIIGKAASLAFDTETVRCVSAIVGGERIDPALVGIEHNEDGSFRAVMPRTVRSLEIPNDGYFKFVCPDCNGTREYVGLCERGPCLTCTAGEGE